jgi:hypothetical protein
MTSRRPKHPRVIGQLGHFVQQYARKAQKAAEPNDRGYDRKVEQAMRKLRPEDLSALLSGDGEDEPAPDLSSKD